MGNVLPGMYRKGIDKCYILLGCIYLAVVAGTGLCVVLGVVAGCGPDLSE